MILNLFNIEFFSLDYLIIGTILMIFWLRPFIMLKFSKWYEYNQEVDDLAMAKINLNLKLIINDRRMEN